MLSEFKNDQIEVTVKQEPDCIIKMDITASSDLAQSYFKKAIKNVGKEVTFPGFRKGKAPDKMLLTKYKPQIEREFRELFLNESARQAIDLAKIYPWKPTEEIKAEINEASEEKGGKFTIEFERLPDVPPIKPEEIKVARKKEKEIEEADVQKHLRALRYHHAEWTEVTDRPAQEDDFVRVTMEVKQAKGNESKIPSRDASFHLSKEDLEGWMYNLLVGKKIGETFEMTPPLPEKDLSNDLTELQQNPRTFLVTLNKIETAEIGELNDAFAEKYGAESLADLQEKVKKHLETEAKEQGRKQQHIEIEKALAESCDFEIPSSLKMQEKKMYENELVQSLKNAHYTEEEIKNVQEKIETLAEKNAYRNIKIYYLLYKIIETEKITATKDEVLRETIKQSLKQDGTVNMEMIQNPTEYYAPTEKKLLFDKALDYLAERVTYKDEEN